MSTVTTSPICLALDTRDAGELRRWAEATADSVGIYKVGLTSIYSIGPDIVGELTKVKPVFVDAKLNDIPAQVEGAVGAIAAMEARYVTVHALGGFEMVRAAAFASGADLDILAVTILTSLDERALARIGIEGSMADAVVRLAELALDAGAEGLVCSPHEVAVLRAVFGDSSAGGPVLVVPGIRPAGTDVGDQSRTLGPREALDAGADYLVIGRPITSAKDPARAAADLLAEVTR